MKTYRAMPLPAGVDAQQAHDKLLEIELEHEIDESPCGGSHRLVGLTMARNRHLASGGKLDGVWMDTAIVERLIPENLD